MEEIDLKDLFKIFWNKKSQIIVTILIFMVLGIIYTVGLTKPEYTSSAKVVLAASNNKGGANSNQQTTYNDITLNSKLVDTYGVILKSEGVISKVISNLGMDIDEESLKKNIEVTSVKNTEVIEIAVTDEDKYRAEKIANEITKVFMEKVKEIYKLDNVQILDEAEVSEEPSNINPAKDVLIFTFVGIIFSCVPVFIANMLDTTVKSSEEIESTYKIPVLVSIPNNEEINLNDRKKSKKGGRR